MHIEYELKWEYMKTKAKFLLISVLFFSLVLSGCVSPSQPEESAAAGAESEPGQQGASSGSFAEGEGVSERMLEAGDSSVPDINSGSGETFSLIRSVTLFPANATPGACINVSVEAVSGVETVEIAGEDVGLVNENGTWKGSIIAPLEAGAYALEITARDGSRGSAKTSVPYKVLLLEGGVDITVSPRANNVTAGEEVLVNIRVKNTQNIDDVFRVYLDVSKVPAASQAEPGWFEWTEKTVELRTGQDVSIPLSVNVPEGATSGYRLFSAKVVSETSKVQGFDTGYLNLII